MARRTSTATAIAPEPPTPAPAEPTGDSVTLTGRLCADPVLRHTKSGKAVTTIRLAINDGPEARFHNVVAWGRTAEVICQYKRKGHSISAEGRWQERSWDGEDGKTYTVIELNAFRVDFGSRERNVAGEKAVA